MRPINENLRQAKLAVALEQLSTIETRYSKALKALQDLEQQWNKKVEQVQSLGGQVATGLEQVPVYQLDTDATTDTNTVAE